ncbi:serine/threonine-protein kinase RsbT [Pararobbsia alpina]|uniref:ATP-binding protein n=1 Tax=Pararobbsia alpina TaxID=621374 RepID=UPI0039A4B89E
MRLRILSMAIDDEQAVVAARQRSRDIARELGCTPIDQTRVATAVSEIARNAFEYARNGRVDFEIEGDTRPQLLLIRVSDKGPGIEDLDALLAGRYRSKTGMGIGIVGSRRLMDQCNIESVRGEGTTVTLKKLLPDTAPLVTPELVGQLSATLAAHAPGGSFGEVQQQNRELIAALADLRDRQIELTQLTQELEDTNRGVVALYAELDERADHLRRADEMKSRFLSNMSHEFRTPLSSIRALSNLLLDRVDGDLGAEQERQVTFIRKAAEDLSEIVNDLLDLAKIEAGKIEIHPAPFEVASLFSALRGMLRPLLVGNSVDLVFEDAGALPELRTDEAKVAQIIRNFVSNALKFTERGEVRVSARLDADACHVIFSVADTGIGIAEADQQRIFEEFGQIENPLQQRVKGTGLGLPLCTKLCNLLGGRITLQSTPGAGSVFSAIVPRDYVRPGQSEFDIDALRLDDGKLPILIVEDEPQVQVIYEGYLRATHYQPIMVRALHDATQVLDRLKPAAIVLDILLAGEDSWHWLAAIKSSPERRAIPLIVASEVDDPRKGRALGADAYFIKPLARDVLVTTLDRMTADASEGPDAGAWAGAAARDSARAAPPDAPAAGPVSTRAEVPWSTSPHNGDHP